MVLVQAQCTYVTSQTRLYSFVRNHCFDRLMQEAIQEKVRYEKNDRILPAGMLKKFTE